ncbi:hypothetical protein N0V88_008203 [Collariella sp. IMI 366227]|nr:hypothetical protein N0V88_008203 [Collariella sp. IMI 366227]
MAADESGAFLAYHEPNKWLADKIIRASLIGQIIVGLIYGLPIANILARDWQETFLALGYIGLILIIFEGGLTVRLDLLRQNLILSIIAALLGVLTPIALSFALFYAGFHHAANIDFSQTRIGTILVSAALLDDICGLVLVSVIHNLSGIAGEGGGGEDAGLGWIIGLPVLASGLMAVLTPAVAKFGAGPVYRRFLERMVAVRFGHVFNIFLMAMVLCGFLAIAAYAGASMLFGAFLAGAFLSALPSKARRSMQEEDSPEFMLTFDKYLNSLQKYIFQPLFFASIGFAIPFLDLWTGEVIWKGIVYTILMAFGKLIVGIVVPVWDFISSRRVAPTEKTKGEMIFGWAPATLLGAAMVARGEIGLLIIQIGLNETSFLSQKAFVIGVWAILLNTIVGPVLVGVLLPALPSNQIIYQSNQI